MAELSSSSNCNSIWSRIRDLRSERGPLELARQFLDPQLLMSDQGLIIGGFGSGHREFRFGVRRAGRFGDKGRLQVFRRRLEERQAANPCDDRIMNPDR